MAANAILIITAFNSINFCLSSYQAVTVCSEGILLLWKSSWRSSILIFSSPLTFQRVTSFTEKKIDVWYEIKKVNSFVIIKKISLAYSMNTENEKWYSWDRTSLFFKDTWSCTFLYNNSLSRNECPLAIGFTVLTAWGSLMSQKSLPAMGKGIGPHNLLCILPLWNISQS